MQWKEIKCPKSVIQIPAVAYKSIATTAQTQRLPINSSLQAANISEEEEKGFYSLWSAHIQGSLHLHHMTA